MTISREEALRRMVDMVLAEMREGVFQKIDEIRVLLSKISKIKE